MPKRFVYQDGQSNKFNSSPTAFDEMPRRTKNAAPAKKKAPAKRS